MKLKDAVLEVLKRHDGAATTATLFAEVPNLTTAIKSTKSDKILHSIRGMLSHLTGDNRGSPKLIKRIGLATYALIDYEAENNLFDEIATEKVAQESFITLPETKLHGHLQGMLVEIGNMRNFDTYTPDKNVIFNGKSLADISSLESIPQFTYNDRIDIVRQIDVIWFKDGYPVQTFDVENSTNFTNAFVRSYQLKYFTAKCYMIADKRKQNVFNKRLATKPFDEIKGSVEFVENAAVFETYKRMMHLHNFKSENPFL